MKPRKKSQVTIFMLVGLLIVILVGFVLVTKSSKTQLGKSKLEELFIKKGKYSHYLQSCLDLAAKEALVMAGMQGGAIYSDQVLGGKAIDEKKFVKIASNNPLTNKPEDFRINIAIFAPKLGSQQRPLPPEYPFGARPLVAEPMEYNSAKPFGNIGKSPLIPLCDSFGLNAKTTKGISCGTFTASYDSNKPDDHNSIQEYLQIYAAKKIDECIKFENMPELKGYEIKKENLNVEIIIGETTIDARLNLTLNLKSKTELPPIIISDISVKKEVRLKEIYELLSHLIDNDINNIFFDIVKSASSSEMKICYNIKSEATPCLKPGMVVSKQELPNNDKLLIIKDTKSSIDGRAYQFMVVLQNRIPALEYIHDFNLKDIDYDIIAVEGMTLTIDAHGIDPDEDEHEQGKMKKTYTYYGWGEDTYTFFDYLDEEGNPLCSPDASQSIPALVAEMNKCIISATPKHIWGGSAMFKQTSRAASHKITEGDSGEHEVTVKVCDSSGLCDSQKIKILILPLAAIKPTQGNYYIQGNAVFKNPTGDLISVGKSLELPADLEKTEILNDAAIAETDEQGVEELEQSEMIAGEGIEGAEEDTEESAGGWEGEEPVEPVSETPAILDIDIVFSEYIGKEHFSENGPGYEVYYDDNTYFIVPIGGGNAEKINQENKYYTKKRLTDYLSKYGYSIMLKDKKLVNDIVPPQGAQPKIDVNMYILKYPACMMGEFHEGYCKQTGTENCYYNMGIINHEFIYNKKTCNADEMCGADGCA